MSTSQGFVGDEPVDFTYSDGALKWSSATLQDEEIISVKIDANNDKSYTIISLPAAVEAAQKPFNLYTTKATSLPPKFLERHSPQHLPSYLQADNDIYILISTLSGTGLAQDFFDDVLHPIFLSIGLADSQYNVIHTENAESVLGLAKDKLLSSAEDGKAQTVLLLGGDGGVVDLINGLLWEEQRSSRYVRPVLVQLPLGTGNALYHSLHKSISASSSMYSQSLHTLLSGKPKPLPIFKASFSPGARLLTNEAQTITPLRNNTLYGAVVASYGLHSTLVADSDTTEYRKHGDKRFGLVAKNLLFPGDGSNPHAYKATVTLVHAGTQQGVDRTEHGYLLATLVSNLEKTFTISPDSKPFDGALRLVHFGPLSGEATMDLMKAAYGNGRHIHQDEVGYITVESLKINFNESGDDWKWRRCCIDGLIVGIEEGGWTEVSVVEPGKEALAVVSRV